MKIWITEIGEPLPLEKDVRLHRYGQFSKALAKKGHQVTWWASSFSHAPKKHFAEKDTEVDYEGVRLKLIKGPGYPRNISLERIQHTKHFAERFAELAEKEEKPDLIISPIPTIETAYVATQYALKHKVPILTDIRDRWPDEIKDLAPKPLRPLARLALSKSYQRMNWVCQHVDGIMGVSPGELEYGLRFARRKKGEDDLVFPHGYSPSLPPEERVAEALKWCEEQGISEKNFNICFFGTIGRFFDLETVIQAAKKLATKDVVFILAGDGGSREKYMKMAKDVPHVLFPGWLDAPKIQAIMRLSKAGIAPYLVGSVMSMPNKPFEYMSGGLPVISSIQGELKGILAEHQCGVTYRGDSPEDLIAKVNHLIENPEERQKMGENARKVFAEKFSTDRIFAQVEEFLIDVQRRHASP